MYLFNVPDVKATWRIIPFPLFEKASKPSLTSTKNASCVVWLEINVGYSIYQTPQWSGNPENAGSETLLPLSGPRAAALRTAQCPAFWAPHMDLFIMYLMPVVKKL